MTNVKIGDQVRFLNAVGGGFVSRIDSKTIYVEDEDGFEIPVGENEIVIIDQKKDSAHGKPEAADFQKAEISKPRPAVMGEVEEIVADDSVPVAHDAPESDSPRFNLAFLRSDNGNNAYVNLYAINDCNYFVFFTLSEAIEGATNVNMLHYGTIEPNTKLLLGRYNPQRIDNQTWQTQLILYKRGRQFGLYPPVSSSVKIKSNRFYRDNGFVDNDFFDEKAVIIPIIKNEFEQKIEELGNAELLKASKQKESRPKVSRPKKAGETVEVDLHINELIDNTAGLKNSEILKIQLDAFEAAMAEFSGCRGQRVVFIHGVGNGTLKTELRKRLDRNYKKVTYQDASFKEYGFGATMVIF